MTVVTPARPQHFTCRTTAESLGQRGVKCASAEQKPPILVASGSAEEWSPLGLLIGAVETSVILTFTMMAEKHGLPVEACYSETEALVELDEGTYRLGRVTIRPTIIVPHIDSKARALKIMEIAERESMVVNSLSAPVVVQPTVVIGDAGPALQ